ncbi:hypothetical protein [Pseudohalocynthiibacter aestuariivivens]
MKIFSRRAMLGFVCAFALSSCGAAQETGAEPEPEPKAFTINDVQLTVIEGAAQGRFEEDDTRIAALEAELEKTLGAVQGGDISATALISISSMRLKTAGARTFGGSNQIEATVRIVDASGNLLQPNGSVGYWDQAKNTEFSIGGNPIIGNLISLGRNAAHSENGKDVGQLLSGFSDAMVDWLKS